jgi:hypothetical protein
MALPLGSAVRKVERFDLKPLALKSQRRDHPSNRPKRLGVKPLQPSNAAG